MRRVRPHNMKFSVPYYSQTSEFTCGPACVLMVMKHFDPSIHLTRELEFEVWRQCNMIGIPGADPYGLSVPLLDAGYDVRLITKRKRVADRKPWMSRLHRLFSRSEIELSFFGMEENQRRALARRLLVKYKRPKVTDLVEELRHSFVPVALVHMGVVHSLNIPHWVVVTGADEERIVFNDPYPPKGQRGLILPHFKFQKILDDIGPRIGLTPSVLFVRKG